MSRLLEIAIEHEIEAATRVVADAKNRVDAYCSKRGIARSSSHIILVIDALAESAKKLTAAVFRRAIEVHERAGVSETEAREMAIVAVRAFIESLREKMDDVCKMSNAGESAYQVAHTRFQQIDRDFAREAELYREGVDFQQCTSFPSVTHNTVSINGDGNTLIAQQATNSSVQNIRQTNAVLERLSAVIDDQPLTGSARREVEAIVSQLKAEAAKPAPEKGKLGTLLSNVSAALGIAKSATEVVKAVADVSHTLGLT